MNGLQCLINVTLAVLGLSGGVAVADDSSGDFGPRRYQWYGFLTQGALYARGNNYFGQDNGHVSLDFREIGLGGNFSLTPKQRLAGLLLSRDAGATDDGNVRIDHLLLDSHWGSLANWQIRSQLGRVKIPLGFFNETRDVAASRPSILLPQSIYFDNARKFLINSDGVYLRANYLTEASDTVGTLGVAITNGVNNPETESHHLGRNHPGYLAPKPGGVLRVVHSRRSSGTTLLAQIGTNVSEYRPEAVDYLTDGRIDTRALWLGWDQNWNPISVRIEAFRANISRRGFGPVIPDSTNRVFGSYGEVGYDWQRAHLFLRYDVSYVDLDDRQGIKLSAATGRPAYDFFARDWAAGIRYNILSNASLSVDYHYIDGTGWLPISDNPVVSDRARYWHLLATQLTINF